MLLTFILIAGAMEMPSITRPAGASAIFRFAQRCCYDRNSGQRGRQNSPPRSIGRRRSAATTD